VWDSILSFQTWGQLMTILNHPSRRQSRARLRYPLRGVLTCGECGTYLDSSLKRATSGKVRGYRCRAQIPEGVAG
jgi:hypothetical protein